MKIYLFDSTCSKMYEALRWHGAMEEREAFAEFSGGEVKADLTLFQGKDLYFLKILAIESEPTARSNCLYKGDWLLRSFGTTELKIMPNSRLTEELERSDLHWIVPVRITGFGVSVFNALGMGQVPELLTKISKRLMSYELYDAENIRPYEKQY